MEQEQVELLSRQVNAAVLRIPGRRFPGVLVQGDTLSSLFAGALDTAEALAVDNRSDAFYAALDLAERLEALLLSYEEALRLHQIALPYFRDADTDRARIARLLGTSS
jgi:hypothetical protein